MIRLISLFLLTASLEATLITHYRAPSPLMCYGHHAVLRSFLLDGKHKCLVVNTQTLQTSISDPVLTIGHPCHNNHYSTLLDRAASAPYPLQNDGITHQHGSMTITTDLCPSSKAGFEKGLYQSLITHFKNPVPVTLFITKRWIDHHPKALRQFQTWERSGKLAITWGNHTAYHHYYPGKPLRHNFVLSPGEYLTQDVLDLEKSLIEHGITPSVFFRFPGLISDKKAVQTIRRLGLIPIGTDAWIAKGQKPRVGSIILLHGNKNEPKGVEMFLQMLHAGKIRHIAPLAP